MIEASNFEKVPLNPTQIGYLLSGRTNGFTAVFRKEIAQMLATGKSVRLVLEDGTPPGGLLRSSLERHIREGVPSSGIIHLGEDGSLIDVNQSCPYTMGPAELIEKLGESLSESSMEELRGEFDPEIWADFLAYTRFRLNQMARRHHPTPNLRTCVRGTSAELLLHVLLRRIARTPSSCHQPVLSLIDRSVPLVLPPVAVGVEPRFELKFLAFHNYNLEAHRGSHRETVTEFDAVAVTGLEPKESNEIYSVMYLFDVTTSQSELESKLSVARMDRLAGFRDLLEGNGLLLHQFNIFMYDPDTRGHITYLRQLGQEKNHVVLLPLNRVVEEISQAAAEDLKIDIGVHETTVTSRRRQSQVAL